MVSGAHEERTEKFLPKMCRGIRLMGAWNERMFLTVECTLTLTLLWNTLYAGKSLKSQDGTVTLFSLLPNGNTLVPIPRYLNHDIKCGFLWQLADCRYSNLQKKNILGCFKQFSPLTMYKWHCIRSGFFLNFLMSRTSKNGGPFARAPLPKINLLHILTIF